MTYNYISYYREETSQPPQPILPESSEDSASLNARLADQPQTETQQETQPDSQQCHDVNVDNPTKEKPEEVDTPLVNENEEEEPPASAQLPTSPNKPKLVIPKRNNATIPARAMVIATVIADRLQTDRSKVIAQALEEYFQNHHKDLQDDIENMIAELQSS
ncbi:hypothetical protein IQ272_13420 [Chroococcidiopsidales cyanobacterium LEGE 13417]|nr:hypothetical protein [Chroococcidiopsidales cyanobacterium LEGE 13417]